MTQEEVDFHIEAAEEAMQAALEHLQKELNRIRAGKASPDMFGSVYADFYGASTPITQMANISAADARTLVIQPWDKSVIGAIERAIFDANLGVTPQNDGQMIRITIPVPTEERRRELVKKAKALVEDAKVGIRNARRDANEAIKKAVKDGYPEDMGKRMEEKVQNMTNETSKKADHMLEAKEQDIMRV